MRKITKGQEPNEIGVWKAENEATPQVLTYANMPKSAVKLQMLAEQRYLCAYTMLRIDAPTDCHIEHIVPQTQSTGRAIDYDNLLACFPGNFPPPEWEPKYPYGAQNKAGAYVDESNFISPLREDVEQRFTYTASGYIRETNAADVAATSTIQLLNLNNPQLTELRKAAIEERVFADDLSLSAAGAEDLAADILIPNSTGRLPEFCLAISQVALGYATKLDMLNE